MIELSWSDFKSQVLTSTAWQWIYFDLNNTYCIYAKQSDFTVLCKIYKDSGADQTEFEDDYKDNANTELAPIVTTQNEKNDKVLKLSCGFADFSSGVAVISIEVPTGGRWVAGGYCFADAWAMGDRITKVQVTHPTYGVVKEYFDSEVAEPNQGWAMYPAHNSTGEIEIDPIGGYGFIPEGFTLEIHAECASATKLAADLWWAKEE
jgi:hypothetical protein